MNNRFMSRRGRVSILIVLVLCASLFPASPAQAANGSFAWAKSMGGTLGDLANHIEVDAAGNVYTTGYFIDTADFDPGPGTVNLTSAGGSDVFVSKLDSSGNFLWAQAMGGAYFDSGRGLALDASGNVYTTGHFIGTVDFDPGPGSTSLTSAGSADTFIVKLDSSGNFVWVRGMGGPLSDAFPTHIEVDSAGRVYTTGLFGGTVDFDPGVSTYTLASAGSYDIFVSKLESNGSFVWARTMGGVDFDRSTSLALDASGNVYTTGDFGGTADFDPGPGIASPTSAGNRDIFVSKLDSNGNYVWARSMGGVDEDRAVSLAVDAAGNVYTSGDFYGTADFDPGVGAYNLVSAGGSDVFVSKLDSSGGFVWARAMGGVEPDDSLGLALDASGNVFTAGDFQGTADFDPGASTYNLTSAGGFDIFVSKLDSNGSFIWARGTGGPGFELARSLAVDSSGNVYTTGDFGGTADFNPGAGTYNLTSAGDADIFIVKLQETAIFADVPLGYWAIDFIERLYGAGITGGCATSPLRYCPEDTVTRAQMGVFLLRGIHTSAYTPPAVGAGTGFGDVPVDYWAAAFIKQLAAEGITAGCGNGNYCPEQPVTRAQMAVFLLRSKYGASYMPPAVGTSTGFGDVPPTYWAAAFIKQLVTEGITAGCGGGNYCPEQPVTRAQMAVFLVRTFSLP